MAVIQARSWQKRNLTAIAIGVAVAMPVAPAVKKFFEKIRGKQDADRPESRRAGTVELRQDAARQIAKEGML